MTEPSPAVQAIRQAIDAVFARSPVPPTTEDVAAAVLRAAVNQVDFDPCLQAHVYYRRQLFAIAAELEGRDG